MCISQLSCSFIANTNYVIVSLSQQIMNNVICTYFVISTKHIQWVLTINGYLRILEIALFNPWVKLIAHPWLNGTAVCVSGQPLTFGGDINRWCNDVREIEWYETSHIPELFSHYTRICLQTEENHDELWSGEIQLTYSKQEPPKCKNSTTELILIRV
jgi:hypothetical protein